MATETKWRNRIVGYGEEQPEQLLANPRNFRVHPKAQQDALLGVMREVGVVDDVIVNRETGFVVDGHLRVALAIGERQKTIPVKYVDLTEQEEALILATFDPIAAMAATDKAQLDALLREVSTEDAAVQSMLAEMAKREGLDYGAEPKEAPEPQIDRAEELREKWGTETGQLWIIGRHRLLCGDSTKAEDVARLMGGERAALCFTSPPYLEQRDYTQKITDWDGLMQGVCANLPMAEGSQVLVNLGLVHRDGEWLPYWDAWLEWMRANGWARFAWYVWDKLDGMPGDYHGRLWPAHEFIFHFVASKHAGTVPVVTGNRKADGSFTGWTGAGKPVQAFKVHDSVFRMPPAKGGVDGHPAPFPVNLPAEVIAIFTNEGDAVYEPFTGSGTTLVAAEQTGRVCYGMEIEPKYIAVTLERLSQMGLEPRLADV